MCDWAKYDLRRGEFLATHSLTQLPRLSFGGQFREMGVLPTCWGLTTFGIFDPEHRLSQVFTRVR